CCRSEPASPRMSCSIACPGICRRQSTDTRPRGAFHESVTADWQTSLAARLLVWCSRVTAETIRIRTTCRPPAVAVAHGRCRGLRDAPKLRLHVLHPRADCNDYGNEVHRHDVELPAPKTDLLRIVDVDAA